MEIVWLGAIGLCIGKLILTQAPYLQFFSISAQNLIHVIHQTCQNTHLAKR
jgi:hypothetical protein